MKEYQSKFLRTKNRHCLLTERTNLFPKVTLVIICHEWVSDDRKNINTQLEFHSSRPQFSSHTGFVLRMEPQLIYAFSIFSFFQPACFLIKSSLWTCDLIHLIGVGENIILQLPSGKYSFDRGAWRIYITSIWTRGNGLVKCERGSVVQC